MQRLRVLYISHLHPQKNAVLENMGGMQRVSMQLVDELSRHPNVELRPITLETSWKYAGINTTWFLFRLIGELPAIIRSWKPDVVLFSSMVTASLSIVLKKMVDVPLVTVNHGQDVTMPVAVYQALVPRIFNSLDGVVSVSGATRQVCIDRGMDPGKGTVIPNGFVEDRIGEVIKKNDARKRLENLVDLNFSNLPILLTVGRMVRRKGHVWFIREVLPKINHSFHYIVIGDGPERPKVVEAVNKSESSTYIHLLGRQPDGVLKAAYAAADIFVMPNIPVPGDMEGFGIVLLEANLAGTATVASDLEGIRDVVCNGENGYRVPPEKPELFAEKIDNMLTLDSYDIGERARAYVEAKFNWKSVIQQYVDYLNRIVEHGRTLETRYVKSI